MSLELLPVRKHLQIHGSWVGLTVLEATRRAFPELSPREVFRKARRREVVVGDQPCQALERLGPGDVVTVVLYRPAPPRVSAVLREQVEAATGVGPFWIVREDEELLAVSKPAGCASHPALRHSGDTLIERVRDYLGTLPGDPFQPALANRLDIGTSGLVLVGKTARAQGRLGKHLQRGTIRKTYLALVGGWPSASEEIRLPLPRHPDSRDLERYRQSGRALPEVKLQEAVTRYRVLQRLGPPVSCSLLEIELVTGRTHQIRRHMAHVGHPVAGDARYGAPEFSQAARAVAGLRRLFLHAHRVSLAHPSTGEPLDLVAPLPADLVTCLQNLGGTLPAEMPTSPSLTTS